MVLLGKFREATLKNTTVAFGSRLVALFDVLVEARARSNQRRFGEEEVSRSDKASSIPQERRPPFPNLNNAILSHFAHTAISHAEPGVLPVLRGIDQQFASSETTSVLKQDLGLILVHLPQYDNVVRVLLHRIVSDCECHS